jgi:hypothetical protein
LSLQIGSIGAVMLAALVASVALLERRKQFLAGLAMSLLVLKPPIGFPIILLVGFCRFLRRDLQWILGVAAGGAAMVAAGLLYDPSWIQEFIAESAAPSVRAVAGQSTLWSLSYLLCNARESCSVMIGSTAFLVLLALGGSLIWRHRESLTAWEAFNIAIPISFLGALYAFSYDQIVFVIPVVWIAWKLLELTRSYVWTFVWLVLLDAESIALLWAQARTHTDIWGVVTTGLVLGGSVWLLEVGKRRVSAVKSAA